MIVNINRQSTENLKKGFFFSYSFACMSTHVMCTWAKSVTAVSSTVHLDHSMINLTQMICGREAEKGNKGSAVAPT